MRISPSAASRMRNRQRVMDDLPAPVRPTIPTWTGWGATVRGRLRGQWGLLQDFPGEAEQTSDLEHLLSQRPMLPMFPGPKPTRCSPSHLRARADSGPSAPAPGPACSAQSNSGTPPRRAGASSQEGGYPPAAKGPGQVGKVGLHRGGASSPAWPCPTSKSSSL